MVPRAIALLMAAALCAPALAGEQPAPPAKPVVTAGPRGKHVPLTPGRGPRVSLDVRAVDVRVVLAVLAESAGVRFRIAPDVRGAVSHNQRDLALEDMLDAILPPLGLRWTRGLTDYRVERAVVAGTGESVLNLLRGWAPPGLERTCYADPARVLPSGSLSALLAVTPPGVTAVTGTDARVHFTWGPEGPAPAVGPDRWSARWHGRLWVPVAAEYTFSFEPRGGPALLLVDGQVVLDAWRLQDDSTPSKPVRLSRGWHHAVVDYHQAAETGALSLHWQAPWLPKEIVPACPADPDPDDGKKP